MLLIGEEAPIATAPVSWQSTKAKSRLKLTEIETG